MLHSRYVIVSFRYMATLVFPNAEAKNRASPAVNGSCLPPSTLVLLHPAPLLRSQAARLSLPAELKIVKQSSFNKKTSELNKSRAIKLIRIQTKVIPNLSEIVKNKIK